LGTIYINRDQRESTKESDGKGEDHASHPRVRHCLDKRGSVELVRRGGGGQVAVKGEKQI